MLVSGVIAGGLLVILGIVMLALPNRDTPYGMPRRFFGAGFCALGALCALLGVLGLPFGRG